jgi:tetratricopeptide (TPR) repeat protein
MGVGPLCKLFGKSRQAYYDHIWHLHEHTDQENLAIDMDLWRESVVYSEKQQLSILKRLKDRLGTNGYFLFYLGDSYFRNKDYPKAIQNLKEAKLLYPDKEVFLKLALAYIEDKQISSAEAEYKYLIQSYPAEIDLYYQLGYFYLQIDNNKSLEELKEKVISLKNNSDSKSYETTRKKILQL